jgi:hypothetical protein
MIAGTIFFTNVAWKTKKVTGLASTTGIEIYCQIKDNNSEATIMIQASMPITPSVL